MRFKFYDYETQSINFYPLPTGDDIDTFYGESSRHEWLLW